MDNSGFVIYQLIKPFVKRLAPGLLSLGLLLLLLPKAHLQTPTRLRLDTTGLDSLRTALDYSADVPKEDGREKPADHESTGFFEGLNTVAKIFFVLFLIGLLALFSWLIADQFSTPSDKKVPKLPHEATVDQLEENLPKADLRSAMERALNDGDYNLAVRLLFLNYLKTLIANGLIEWRQDKTNGAYLAELNGKEPFETFSKLTLVFERVWYGKAPLTAKEYGHIEKLFKNATKSRK